MWEWFKRKWQELVWAIQDIWKADEQPQLMEPAAAAMMKVYTACPWIPPDTISGGVLRGGECLFFRHDDATEAFIGKNYDHAADKLIEWLQLQGDEVETRTTTQLTRKERRMHKTVMKREKRRNRGRK